MVVSKRLSQSFNHYVNHLSNHCYTMKIIAAPGKDCWKSFVERDKKIVCAVSILKLPMAITCVADGRPKSAPIAHWSRWFMCSLQCLNCRSIDRWSLVNQGDEKDTDGTQNFPISLSKRFPTILSRRCDNFHCVAMIR